MDDTLACYITLYVCDCSLGSKVTSKHVPCSPLSRKTMFTLRIYQITGYQGAGHFARVDFTFFYSPFQVIAGPLAVLTGGVEREANHLIQ